MKPKVIEVQKIHVSFEGQPVLKGCQLDIYEGECFVLVGPSGRGKTTLLKTMAGLIQPQHGEIKIKNKNIYNANNAERAKIQKSMGMLFQKNALFDSFTCGENIAFALRETTDLLEQEIQEKVLFYLKEVEIDHAKDLFPDEISGGMQKRLGIARALALRPAILFYDDPTAGLDPITSRKIISLIQRLQKEDKSTVVAVTNDMNRAYQMADRIAFVFDEEVLFAGTPEETRHHKDPRVRQFIHGSVDGPLTTLS